MARTRSGSLTDTQVRKGLEKVSRAVRGRGQPIPADQITDVWQWTGKKYRIRATILLLLNAVLFAGLGGFTFWLRTGELPLMASHQYWSIWWEVFDPLHEQQVTLLDFLTYPIPADQVPMMIVILGLVLASLTAIPILVSMLYRFPFSLIFLFIIAFVAVLPWLAITMILSCYLARWKPLRFSFRYATALIALLPIVVYYVRTSHSAYMSDHLAPFEMAKLYMPWVIALIAACVVMAIVLLIARIVKCRPGAIMPLLALMFATPVILFEVHVGRHELHYRLLEHHVNPDAQQWFPNQIHVAELFRRASREEIIDAQGDALDTLIQEVLGQLRNQKSLERAGVLQNVAHELFEMTRQRALAACEEFRARFPNSRYIPNALYLQGRVSDLRLDPAMTIFRDAIILQYYEDVPRESSLPIWKQLTESHPNTVFAIAGLYRQAWLEAEQGQLGAAIEHLDIVLNRMHAFLNQSNTATQPANWRDLLAKRPAASDLQIEPERLITEVKKLRDLVVSNRVVELEPEYKYPVFQELLLLDPHQPGYREHLRELLGRITETNPLSPTRLRDNIQLLIAIHDPSRSRRIRELEKLVDTFARTPELDALARARFELGAAYQADNLIEEARELYELTQDKHPDSPWAEEAARRLATMQQPASF